MNRIQALCGVLRNAEADAMLLTGEVNLVYATSVTNLEGSCLLFPDDTAVFITDGRYIEVAEQLLIPQGFTIRLRTAELNSMTIQKLLLEEHGAKKLLYEDDVLTVRQYQSMMKFFEGFELMPIRDRISNLRACKSTEELGYIEQAQRIAEDAFAELLPWLKIGVTEKEAAARLNYLMAMRGSEKPSFDTILLFGENTSKPHGVPSERKLQAGDFITADFGAVYHGYHSDMTRTFACGSVTDEMRRVYDTVLAAQKAAAEVAREGIPCCEMHQAAANAIDAAGYGGYFTHALGHSVGLEIHESPAAAPSCSLPLQNGVVMTNEPGIYIAGKFGVRIEDMLVIDGNTPHNLTNTPKELLIL